MLRLPSQDGELTGGEYAGGPSTQTRSGQSPAKDGYCNKTSKDVHIGAQMRWRCPQIRRNDGLGMI